MSQSQFSVFFIVDFSKYRIVLVLHFPYLSDQISAELFLFSNQKIYLKEIFYAISKKEFQFCFTNKLARNVNGIISKKMNISLILHFCLSQYNFSLNIFWTQLVQFCISNWRRSRWGGRTRLFKYWFSGQKNLSQPENWRNTIFLTPFTPAPSET